MIKRETQDFMPRLPGPGQANSIQRPHRHQRMSICKRGSEYPGHAFRFGQRQQFMVQTALPQGHDPSRAPHSGAPHGFPLQAAETQSPRPKFAREALPVLQPPYQVEVANDFRFLRTGKESIQQRRRRALHLRYPIVTTDERGAKRKRARMMHKRRQCLFAQEPIGVARGDKQETGNLLRVGWKGSGQGSIGTASAGFAKLPVGPQSLIDGQEVQSTAFSHCGAPAAVQCGSQPLTPVPLQRFDRIGHGFHLREGCIRISSCG